MESLVQKSKSQFATVASLTSLKMDTRIVDPPDMCDFETVGIIGLTECS